MLFNCAIRSNVRLIRKADEFNKNEIAENGRLIRCVVNEKDLDAMRRELRDLHAASCNDGDAREIMEVYCNYLDIAAQWGA
jgi:hypothetical protein